MISSLSTCCTHISLGLWCVACTTVVISEMKMSASLGFYPFILMLILGVGLVAFNPREHLAMSGNIFGCCNWDLGEGTSGIY